MCIKLRPRSVQPESMMANFLLVKQLLEKEHFGGLCQYLKAMNNLQCDALLNCPQLSPGCVQHPGATTNKENKNSALVPNLQSIPEKDRPV